MHLLALVKSADHVCCRYRLAAFRSYLADAGHELELRAWPKSWLGRLFFHRQLRRADVVIVQRRLLAPWEVLLVRRSAKRLVFDFDDAVFLRSSNTDKASLTSAVRQNGFARTVRAADLIIAGNEFLGNQAAAQVTSARLHVVPTCVDTDRYHLAPHRQKDAGIRLAWIGSTSTLKGLERTRELWEEIGKRCPGVTLRLICDRPLKLEHLTVEFRPWSSATEVAELAETDIGISWLPDDSWSRGKCGLKVLQYMAAGLPVIANPVGVQAEMVRHGETGFLAETADQWCEAVRRLATDPELRRRMGQEGRRIVENHYSVAAGAARWLAALDQLAESRATQEAMA
jgi:glycosyltransferase involved in cell wall biosynthesis